MSVLPKAMSGGESVFLSEQVEKLWDLSRNLSDKIISKVEKDNRKIMVFDVQGIPERHIVVDTEFVNKTKSMYIHIDGEYCDEYLEFEREIHEKIHVNTDVYDGYDFGIERGLLILCLYEKINMPPDFKKLGEGYC